MAGLCDTCKNTCKQDVNATVVVCPTYDDGKKKEFIGEQDEL